MIQIYLHRSLTCLRYNAIFISDRFLVWRVDLKKKSCWTQYPVALMFTLDIWAGPLRKDMLWHGQASTHAQKHLKCDKLHMQIKLLSSSFYYIIACVWCVYSLVTINCCNCLLNWSNVYKYFDSVSYWFCIEIKKVFLSVQFTSI